MVKLVKNDGSAISYSRAGAKPALKRAISWLKCEVKAFFKWGHKKLTDAENWTLKKIDKIGKRAEKYLDKRINGNSAEIFEANVIPIVDVVLADEPVE